MTIPIVPDIAKLEKENAALRKENEELKRKIKKFEEMYGG